MNQKNYRKIAHIHWWNISYRCHHREELNRLPGSEEKYKSNHFLLLFKTFIFTYTKQKIHHENYIFRTTEQYVCHFVAYLLID